MVYAAIFDAQSSILILFRSVFICGFILIVSGPSLDVNDASLLLLRLHTLERAPQYLR